MTSSWKRYIDFLRHSEGGQALYAKIDDAMRGKLLKAMPGLKERAQDAARACAERADFCSSFPNPTKRRDSSWTRKGSISCKKAYPVLAANTDWTAARLDKDMRRFADAAQGQARQGGAAAARGAHRIDDFAGDLRGHGGARTRRVAAAHRAIRKCRPSRRKLVILHCNRS